MLEKNQIEEIKKTTTEFFERMTAVVSSIEASISSSKKDLPDTEKSDDISRDIVDLDIKLEEPQILIGQQGQTLFEVQRLLRMVLIRKFGGIIYLNLDINDYKKKKTEYLRDLAKSMADQVALTKEEKKLLPMPAYERRIIHSELSQRTDVITESQGDDFDRHVVIKPR